MLVSLLLATGTPLPAISTASQSAPCSALTHCRFAAAKLQAADGDEPRFFSIALVSVRWCRPVGLRHRRALLTGASTPTMVSLAPSVTTRSPHRRADPGRARLADRGVRDPHRASSAPFLCRRHPAPDGRKDDPASVSPSPATFSRHRPLFSRSASRPAFAALAMGLNGLFTALTYLPWLPMVAGLLKP